MDSIALVGVITGLTGFVIAILTHIKHSECCKGFIEIETRERVETISTPNPTPIIHKKEIHDVQEISV